MSRLKTPESVIESVQQYYDGLMVSWRQGTVAIDKFTVMLKKECAKNGISIATFYRRSLNRRTHNIVGKKRIFHLRTIENRKSLNHSD